MVWFSSYNLENILVLLIAFLAFLVPYYISYLTMYNLHLIVLLTDHNANYTYIKSISKK